MNNILSLDINKVIPAHLYNIFTTSAPTLYTYFTNVLCLLRTNCLVLSNEDFLGGSNIISVVMLIMILKDVCAIENRIKIYPISFLS